MKRSIYLATILSFSSLISFGQTRSYDPRASYIAKETVNQLHLSEYEFIKVRNLMRDKFQEIDEVAERFHDDQPMYTEAVAQIESRYDQEIINSLPKSAQLAYLPHKAVIYKSAMAALQAKK